MSLSRGRPFARSLAITSMLASAMSIVGIAARQAALGSIPEYFSRGKGRAKAFQRSREYREVSRNSTYFPPSKRNGERERLRRMFQMARGDELNYNKESQFATAVAHHFPRIA